MREYFIPRPGQGPVSVARATCNNFKAKEWAMSVLYMRNGKSFLSVLFLGDSTGRQYTLPMS